MIRDFWVKNYLSIRDKQELSFVAKGPSSELVSEVAEGVFLYKLGILYGSNASGKSNMLEVFRILVIPKSDATKRIDGSIPFILTKNDPLRCMCHSMLMLSDMIMMCHLMRNAS